MTVDWVVMSAAIVGLGIASAGAVRLGTSALGTDIESSLSGAGVASMAWLSSREVLTQSFADGNFDGWSVARPGNFGEWGAMQGPFGLDTLTTPLTFDVALSAGASNALIEFDLIVADSWDGVEAAGNPWVRPGGDVLRFQINGQTISTEAFVFTQNHPGYQPGLFEPRSGTVEIGRTNYNLRITPINLPTSNFSGNGSPDQRWRVQIKAVNAPQTFQLGLSASETQAAGNESYGIANFSVVEN